MAPISVNVKHASKSYTVNLDPDLPGKAFKEEVYQVTGVPVDRMKVMVKGGVLKDDASWSKISPKEGQTFMVIGAAGELPKPPAQPIVFLEDMDDSELAEALEKPVGLRNLGNTCYMNATLQTLRAIPELKTAITTSGRAGTGNEIAAAPPTTLATNPLATSLGSLFTRMSQTADPVVPTDFLGVNPQFAEQDRHASRSHTSMMGAMYAQQDADECLTTIVSSLVTVPGVPSSNHKKFIEQFMTGEMVRTLKCVDLGAVDEPPTQSSEKVLKITCNIDATVNYMSSGIQKSLSQTVVKFSPTLGRDADYSQESRINRLPSYLFVHMARFAWKADIGKKAKIMRKVKFPTEYDGLDLASDELKAKLLPDIEKERAERRKVRRRTKAAKVSAPAPSASGVGDVEMADAAPASGSSTTMEVDAPAPVQGGDLEEESVYRDKELAELQSLVDPTIKADTGASVSGLYDLVAIITHKGAAADAGHYIGFVKKSVFHPPKLGEEQESDEDWYKFDDDQVSIFPQEKLTSLDGGGQDSSAYLLLYKEKPLA
ncbi:unnamed protein product [Mycena citricolor]|uniref:Ubiquitin carboxyl-terminal hydrolase n=1 Tax=Mycena citricolor TaxID=2018698 RepID=A0AAD2H7S1_9AGAR|nr:unnamed protein product [Mycena citricolor]